MVTPLVHYFRGVIFQIFVNVKSKDLLLVGIQLLLMGAFVLPVNINDAFGVWPDSFRLPLPVAIGFIAAGSFVAAAALWQIRSFITPFPSPREEAVLQTHGLFRWVRHPVYASILLVFIAYSLYAASFYKLGITLLLGFLFHIKTAYEERMLSAKFEGYSDYQRRSGRFFPKLLRRPGNSD